MPAVLADLSIASRWTLPMTSRGEILENHTLVVRDGRIVDLLPSADAATRYAAAMHVDRPAHLLLPGLVNAQTGMGVLARRASSVQVHDAELLRIAEMLRAGTTCFCATGYFPDESVRAAVEQGMRALIGIPIAEGPSAWARTPGEYLTRALRFRDEYRSHPSIATAFAPQTAAAISDATFARIATLANELDAAILVSLHESLADIDASVEQHGLRPIERLQVLGLLTPALTAVNMVHIDDADLEMAQRSDIAITLCPESNLRLGHGPPPVARWAGTGLRLGVGSGTEDSGAGLDLWSQLRLLALLSRTPATRSVRLSAWDAISIATRGGAAALGLEAEIGTLETGKWADLCCVDVRSPAIVGREIDVATQLAFNGGRDLVTDVWVAGRHLLDAGRYTRLDWTDLAARMTIGELK
jgi:5-methylthioadenosine/S-adenosylhomocysteine deaminase